MDFIVNSITVVVDWNTHKVTDKIDYLTADEEDSFVVAQANSPLNEDGSFVNDVVMARYVSQNLEVPVYTTVWSFDETIFVDLRIC